MDTDRYVKKDGNTYFQVCVNGTFPETDKVYGLKAVGNATQVVEPVEVESSTTSEATTTALQSLLSLLVTKNVITQEEADEIMPSS